MADYMDRAFEDRILLVDQMIAEIEGDKGRERIELDDHKEAFNAGRWKSLGYTKTELNERIQRSTGKVAGFERALSTLYMAKGQLESMNDGSLANGCLMKPRDLAVVYRASEWKGYDAVDEEDKKGWPWQSDSISEVEVLVVIFDPDTASYAVIIDE